jgi:hypothetical protein
MDLAELGPAATRTRRRNKSTDMEHPLATEHRFEPAFQKSTE